MSGGDKSKCEKGDGSCKKEGAAAPEVKKLKACCACPETKQVRDKCIMDNGEEHCGKLIDAHKDCMRKLGFNI